jgi:hypothetical protein
MQSHRIMLATLFLAALSSAPGLSTDRFLVPESTQHVKEDAMHMWAVADMELHEAKDEEHEAHDAMADGKAIEVAAAVTAKVEEARAKKELKGKNLDAALGAARDEESRELKDAKQMEDIAIKEEKDAEHTKNEGAKVRHDATAIESATMPAKKIALSVTSSILEVENEKADAKQLRLVADIEEHEAADEQVEARDDAANGKAIEGITKKGNEVTDAKQMEAVATNEARDAADTVKDAERMRKDAAAIEAVLALK